MWELSLNGAEVIICPETSFSYYPHHYPHHLKNGLKAFYCHGNWLMNMQTPWDNCLMVFSSNFLPGNLFFLLPSSLPASSKRSVVRKGVVQNYCVLGKMCWKHSTAMETDGWACKHIGKSAWRCLQMVDSPQIIFESLWPSWTGSSTITRITSEVVQNAVNVENIDFFGSFMEPRHQGIIWDGPQVKIRKLITRVTSLQSCTLLWACSRALTGPRYPNLGFFRTAVPHTEWSLTKQQASTSKGAPFKW